MLGFLYTLLYSATARKFEAPQCMSTLHAAEQEAGNSSKS